MGSVVLINSKVEFLVVLGSVQKRKERILGSLPQIKAGIVRFHSFPFRVSNSSIFQSIF